MDLAALVDFLRHQGAGAALDAAGHAPTDGYLVALDGTEEGLPASALTVGTLTRYLARYSDQPGYLTAWHAPDDTIYLTVSRHLETLSAATALAHEQDQPYLLDVTADRVLPV